MILHDIDSLSGLTYNEDTGHLLNISLPGYVGSATNFSATLTTTSGKHASWGNPGFGVPGEKNIVFVAPKDGWYRYMLRNSAINSNNRVNGDRSVYAWKSLTASSASFNGSSARALQSSGAERTGFAAAIYGEVYLKQGERLILNTYSSVQEERFCSVQLVRWWGEL